MKSFFWIFLIIDCLVLLGSLYETFAVSSNRSMGSMMAFNTVLLAAIIGALWLRVSNPKWAFYAAALPAFLLVLVVVYYIIFAMGRKDWR